MNGNAATPPWLVMPMQTPHSLGKLIEWKQAGTDSATQIEPVPTPHSLGKLIEWKREFCEHHCCRDEINLPTRWGN